MRTGAAIIFPLPPLAGGEGGVRGADGGERAAPHLTLPSLRDGPLPLPLEGGEGIYVVIFNSFERMVAFRYLRARRAEGFVSVIAIFSLLGIALGVATLIIVMSVMNGFRADLMGRILGLNGDLGVYAESGSLGDFTAAAQKVRQVPGVTAAIPMVEGQVMATTDAGASGALVHGIRPADLRALRLVSQRIVAGSLAGFGDDGVAIGYRLAQRLGVGVGGRVTVISPQGTATVFGTMPRIKTYHVAALFDVGMYEYDNSFIYAPLDAAQLFFRLPQAVNDLQVYVADPDRVNATARRIISVLGGKVRIVDWQEANSSLFNAVEIERNVMFLILTLIIVVAAFNIISSMIMMVKDKGRDIAILRTMGASRGMILRIFMLSGPASASSALSRGCCWASPSPATSRRSASSFRTSSASTCSPRRSISSPGSRRRSIAARSRRS